jgi:hypothetical protein
MNGILALILSLSTPAIANDDPSSAATTTGTLSLSDAEAMEDFSRDRMRWLKPRRARLPQAPYAHTDFTAYTLEWGELQVGLMGTQAGLLPGVQAGTSTLLNLAGIPNGQLKLRALRTGPLDVAGVVTHYRNDGGLTARITNAGMMTSLRLAQPWSLHLSGSYLTGTVAGMPEVGDNLTSTVLNATGWDLQSIREGLVEEDVYLDLSAELVVVKVASDIRLNRRDSLILQGQAAVWGRVETDVGELELPAELGLDAVLEESASGPIPLSEAYTASLSWQWSWKRAYLRVGGGVSSVQGAWLMQSTEFALRFGGETKRTERHLRQGWRFNRRMLRRGADSTLAMNTPAQNDEDTTL